MLKYEKRHGKFGKTGLNNWSISKTEPGVRKGKRSLLACHIRYKCFMETTCDALKVKLGFKVMKLVESHCNW